MQQRRSRHCHHPTSFGSAAAAAPAPGGSAGGSPLPGSTSSSDIAAAAGGAAAGGPGPPGIHHASVSRLRSTALPDPAQHGAVSSRYVQNACNKQQAAADSSNAGGSGPRLPGLPSAVAAPGPKSPIPPAGGFFIPPAAGGAGVQRRMSAGQGAAAATPTAQINTGWPAD